MPEVALYSPSLSHPAIPTSGIQRRNWARVTHPGDGSALNAIGIYNQLSGTASHVAATATSPPLRQQLTAAALNSDAFMSAGSSVNGPSRWSKGYIFNARVTCPDTVNLRYWIGITTETNFSTTLGSNVGSATCAMFRFSTDAPDTNWMCVCRDGSASTIVNSGKVKDTTDHQFTIEYGRYDGRVHFSIDGLEVASVSTNIPPDAQVMHAIGVRTITDSIAKAIQINSFEMEWDQW